MERYESDHYFDCDEQDDDDLQKLVERTSGLIIEISVEIGDACEFLVNLTLPFGQNQSDSPQRDRSGRNMRRP